MNYFEKTKHLIYYLIRWTATSSTEQILKTFLKIRAMLFPGNKCIPVFCSFCTCKKNLNDLPIKFSNSNNMQVIVGCFLGNNFVSLLSCITKKYFKYYLNTILYSLLMFNVNYQGYIPNCDLFHGSSWREELLEFPPNCHWCQQLWQNLQSWIQRSIWSKL